MATDLVSEVVSGLAEGVKEGWREARAEHIRRTTPIGYWRHLFDDFSFSPQEFYVLVQRQLEARAVPDLVTDFILMHEGTVFSNKRLYLELRRERFVFQICAAPFGTGWFVSSRLFDKRRGAKWQDILFLGFVFSLLSLGLSVAYGTLVALAILGTVVTLVWSVMRLAASQTNAARLDDFLCRLPVVGRLYETFFHPDTYFRQDQRNMYYEAVHRSLMTALHDLENRKGLKPLSETESRPVLRELERR